jgi:hypothetical protein
MKKGKFNRKSELEKVQKILNRDSYPRIQMFFLVLITGMSGFFASYMLLKFGLTTIWVRYLASIAFAYVVFIGMLWLWLQWNTRDASSSDVLDGAINLDGIWVSNIKSSAASEPNISGGGMYSGGGSSVDFSSDASSGGEAAGAVGETLGGIAEAEEGAIPIIVIIALLAALFSVFLIVFSLVSSAPILFSELLVDGMLSASLYRRLKGIDRYHWLESAIKRTVWPFVFAAVIFAVAGWTMAHFVPGVTSLGEVIVMLKNN